MGEKDSAEGRVTLNRCVVDEAVGVNGFRVARRSAASRIASLCKSIASFSNHHFSFCAVRQLSARWQSDQICTDSQ